MTILIGQTVSHYRILEKLGGGGMGVVYKAQDLKLDRPVALKFLPFELTDNPDAKQRFAQEARAASALQHVNVCVVHDIDETTDGQMFIAMEYLKGETLKRKIQSEHLRVAESLDIATQILKGLAAAHEHGMVHRDVKPANIMITDGGVVKIVDFGLAKLHGGARLTATGSTWGTAAYMSPEQVRGEAVDHRADLWSVGVILYESIAGHLPFRGEHEVAISYSIINENPLPLPDSVGLKRKDLDGVIARSLEKDPEKRYQKAEEFLEDLQRLQQGLQPTSSRRSRRKPVIVAALLVLLAALGTVSYLLFRSAVPVASEKSVAVLPFVDMSPARDQEYFCDGMTEELINRLSNVQDLRVPARSSVFGFRGTSLGVSEIGAKLGVQSVLEGSVRKSGDRLRITAQLVNVKDGFQLFSRQYDRDLKDIFAIQSDVAQQITSALNAALAPSERERLARQATSNLDAYNLYLRGRYQWRKRTISDLLEAVRNFESAIQLDPNYAPAYVGLADCYAVFPFYRVPGISQEEAYRRAEESAKKALALEPTLAEAHTSLANIRKEGYWDWAGAELEFKRAIELNPRYATARQWHSENLMVQGRQAEALAEAKLAYELEPSSLVISNNLGLQYLMNRQYPEAIAQLKRAIELDPTHPSPHANISSAYLLMSAFREADAEIRLSGAPPALLELLSPAWFDTTAWDSISTSVDAYARANRDFPCSFLARVYSSLNQRDRTFEWLDRSCSAHEPDLFYVIRHPSLDKFLPDPRYTAILRRMGFSPM